MKLKRLILPATLMLLSLTSCEGITNNDTKESRIFSNDGDKITLTFAGSDKEYSVTDQYTLKDGTVISEEDVEKKLKDEEKVLELESDVDWTLQKSETITTLTVTTKYNFDQDLKEFADEKVETFNYYGDVNYVISQVKLNELINYDEETNLTLDSLKNSIIDFDKIFLQDKDSYYVLSYAKDVSYKEEFVKAITNYATSNLEPLYLVTFDRENDISEVVGTSHYDSSIGEALNQVGKTSFDEFIYTDTPTLYHFVRGEENTSIDHVETGQSDIINYFLTL